MFCQGERREDAIFIFAMQPPPPTAVIDNNLQEEITEGRTEECQLELSFLALYSFYNMTCITEERLVYLYSDVIFFVGSLGAISGFKIR